MACSASRAGREQGTGKSPGSAGIAVGRVPSISEPGCGARLGMERLLR